MEPGTTLSAATFVQHDNQELGPYDDEEVCRRLADGRLAYEDMAWREGWEEWRPLHEFYMPGEVAEPIPELPPALMRAPRIVPPDRLPGPVQIIAPPARAEMEREVWSGGPSFLNYAGTFFVALLLGAAFVFFASSALSEPNSFTWALVCAASAAVILAHAAVDRARRRYRVTTRKVAIEYGLFVKSSNEVRVKDIRSISVTKRGLGGFLGVGNVEFSSAASDRAEVIFAGVAGADGVRNTVRAIQADAD